MTNHINNTVRVSKLQDTRYNGAHPNGINVGYVAEGKLLSLEPRILVEKSNGHTFYSSEVTSITEKDGVTTVTTQNSVYTVEAIG